MKTDEMTIQIQVTLGADQRGRHAASKLLGELDGFLGRAAPTASIGYPLGLEGYARQVSITVHEPECADYAEHRSVASFVTVTQGEKVWGES